MNRGVLYAVVPIKDPSEDLKATTMKLLGNYPIFVPHFFWQPKRMTPEQFERVAEQLTEDR